MNKTLFKAEAGVNHNGKISIAKKLINIAKKADADFVKFQIFNTDDLVIKKSPLAKYQKINIKKDITQYDLLKKLELNLDQHTILINYCKKMIKTNWHPVGTCKMGKENDPMAVLNSKLQVKGIDNLRVFDVSMMPNIVAANTNAPAMAIADKATEIMLKE